MPVQKSLKTYWMHHVSCGFTWGVPEIDILYGPAPYSSHFNKRILYHLWTSSTIIFEFCLLVDFNLILYPVCWGCRICWLHLYRGVRLLPSPMRQPVGCGWWPIMFEDGILVTEQSVTQLLKWSYDLWRSTLALTEVDGPLKSPNLIIWLFLSALFQIFAKIWIRGQWLLDQSCWGKTHTPSCTWLSNYLGNENLRTQCNYHQHEYADYVALISIGESAYPQVGLCSMWGS